VVAPTDLTGGGFRLYDVYAIARLELVRTLREPGVGLDEVRRVLVAETTLHDLAAAHLRLVEQQLQQFRARRAVLRTIVRRHTTARHVSLMHKLVSMSDDERDRLINEFRDFVTDAPDVHPGFVERPRSRHPHPPEEPSTRQPEAWIELAETVQDEETRTAVRDFPHRTFDTAQGSLGTLMATPDTIAHVETQRRLLPEARTARQARMPADSPQARNLAERVATGSAELVAATTGNYDIDDTRRRILEFNPNSQTTHRPTDTTELNPPTRYHLLVATINDTPTPDPGPDEAAATGQWLTTTLHSTRIEP
jgi:DNA-binding transcriptional MerR regulator